ncbi:MAG TPA: hypothetical protein VE954_24300 [Oligoflexus sp.]|uniref:hypothetical protein n=1 Tax=Oligoflexus sp. TaxID=1971216 RepID=UPI002D657A55|nr:hypothetical protein [Oligoflexus sp.]HYX36237.1 hypothetical protein [Oligoflexus sp.]
MIFGKFVIHHCHPRAWLSFFLSILFVQAGCGNGPDPNYDDFSEFCAPQAQTVRSIVIHSTDSSEIRCYELFEPGNCQLQLKSEKGLQLPEQKPLPCSIHQGLSPDGRLTWEFYYDAKLIQSFEGPRSCQMMNPSLGETDYTSLKNCQELMD